MWPAASARRWPLLAVRRRRTNLKSVPGTPARASRPAHSCRPRPAAGRPARLVPRTLRAPPIRTRPVHTPAMSQPQRPTGPQGKPATTSHLGRAAPDRTRTRCRDYPERLPFFISLRRLPTSLVPRSSGRTPQPYNLRNTECPRPVRSRPSIQPRTAARLRCPSMPGMAGCSAALSVLLDIIRNKKGLLPLRCSDCALRARRAAALRKRRRSAVERQHHNPTRPTGPPDSPAHRGGHGLHSDATPTLSAAGAQADGGPPACQLPGPGRYRRRTAQSAPDIDAGATPFLGAGAQQPQTEEAGGSAHDRTAPPKAAHIDEHGANPPKRHPYADRRRKTPPGRPQRPISAFSDPEPIGRPQTCRTPRTAAKTGPAAGARVPAAGARTPAAPTQPAPSETISGTRRPRQRPNPPLLRPPADARCPQRPAKRSCARIHDGRPGPRR